MVLFIFSVPGVGNCNLNSLLKKFKIFLTVFFIFLRNPSIDAESSMHHEKVMKNILI